MAAFEKSTVECKIPGRACVNSNLNLGELVLLKDTFSLYEEASRKGYQSIEKPAKAKTDRSTKAFWA